MKKKNILFTFLISIISFLGVCSVKAATLYNEYFVKFNVDGREYTDEVFYNIKLQDSTTKNCDTASTLFINPDSGDKWFSNKQKITKSLLESYGVTADSVLCISTKSPIGYDTEETYYASNNLSQYNVLKSIPLTVSNSGSITVNIKDENGDNVVGDTIIKLTFAGLYEKEFVISGYTKKITGLSTARGYEVEIISPPSGYTKTTNQSDYKSKVLSAEGEIVNLKLDKIATNEPTTFSIYSVDEDDNAVPIKVVYGKSDTDIEVKELEIKNKMTNISTNVFGDEIFVGEEFTVVLKDYPLVEYELASKLTQTIKVTSNESANKVYFRFTKKTSDEGNDDGESDSDDGEEVEEYDYKVRYKDDATGDFIEGVLFKIYSSCNSSGRLLEEEESTESGYKTVTIEDDSSVCLKTTLPSGYKFKNSSDQSKSITGSASSATPVTIVLVPTNSSGTGDSDEEDGGSSGNTDVSGETYDITLVYLDIDTNDAISDVEYKLYSTINTSLECSGFLTEGKSLQDTKKIYRASRDSDNTMCLKTVNIPGDYELHNADDETFLVSINKSQITIYLKKRNSSSETPGDGNNENNNDTTPEDGETVTTGNIKVKIVDEKGKALSGVKYKLCKDSKCDDPLSDRTQESYTNIPFGTYYVKITTVPEGYVLPKDAYDVTISEDKDKSNAELTIPLEKKTAVPDTLLNASKVFTICGIVGMVAGISLLYFNAKKKEEV